MIAILSALALLAAQASPTAETGVGERVLPAELCRGFWLLPVELEPGPSGVRHTLWFLHDTGASATYVDPDSIERVSGRRVETGRRVRFSDASSGPLTINSLTARTADLDHLSMGLGRPIDGIMSVYALQDFLLTLDYPAGEMRIREGRLPRPDGRTVFSTRGPDGRPWLRVDLAGRERPLLIDSGAGGLTLAVNHIDRFNLMDEPRALTSAVRFDRIERRRIARLSGDAMVAGLRVQAPVLEEVPRSELLGGEILRHFVITLDQARKRVRFEPVIEGPIPPAGHVELGAGLRPVNEGLEVFEVFPDTPAHAAGVLPGDLVTHYDGVAIAERGCVSSTDTERLTLTVLRDGIERDIEATLDPVLPAPRP
jgi:hypothetical protein